MSLTIKSVPTSTQFKPRVLINGDAYDPNELVTVIQTAKGMRPTASYEETIKPVADDAESAPAKNASNAAAGLKDPA